MSLCYILGDNTCLNPSSKQVTRLDGQIKIAVSEQNGLQCLEYASLSAARK